MLVYVAVSCPRSTFVPGKTFAERSGLYRRAHRHRNRRVPAAFSFRRNFIKQPLQDRLRQFCLVLKADLIPNLCRYSGENLPRRMTSAGLIFSTEILPPARLSGPSLRARRIWVNQGRRFLVRRAVAGAVGGGPGGRLFLHGTPAREVPRLSERSCLGACPSNRKSPNRGE